MSHQERSCSGIGSSSPPVTGWWVASAGCQLPPQRSHTPPPQQDGGGAPWCAPAAGQGSKLCHPELKAGCDHPASIPSPLCHRSCSTSGCVGQVTAGGSGLGAAHTLRGRGLGLAVSGGWAGGAPEVPPRPNPSGSLAQMKECGPPNHFSGPVHGGKGTTGDPALTHLPCHTRASSAVGLHPGTPTACPSPGPLCW